MAAEAPSPGLPGSLQAYAQLAQASLDPAIWRYLSEGDSAGNARALQQATLVPRPLRAVRGGHTRLQLLGQDLEHPFLLAPVAYQRLFHAEGECGSAMAAAAQGGQFLVSSLASQPLKHITQAVRDGGPPTQQGAPGPWFQLYWQGDRERTARLLQRALHAGCSAVVFTVDAPVKPSSLVLPQQVRAVNLEPAPLPAPGPGQVFDGWMAQAPQWSDLHWLRSQTQLPLLVKGLLHVEDALAALQAGCDGIVVSNHGGRVLAGAQTSLQSLGPIVKAVAGRVPVLLDSGVRSGRDAFVALAHGASAVLLGRPYLWGLAAHGALGVAHVLRLVRDELEMHMALCGCARLGDIGPHCLGMPPPGP